MAKRIDNPLIPEVVGRVGKLVYYRRKGKPCVRRTPNRTAEFTDAEKKNQSKFGRASHFASAVLTDPTQKTRYERAAAGTDGSAQNLAVSDFMHDPVITEVDLSGFTGQAGEVIKIRAEEDVLGAAAVRVSIANRAKTILEQGNALVEKTGFWWSYSAQKTSAPDQAIWITVTASDQAGNKVVKTVRHVTGT
jgi:hypothetical protein